MAELTELYQAVLLEHHKTPRHYGALETRTHGAVAYNPLCGDRVEVHLHLDGAGRVAAVGFEAAACAICTASASMMAEAVSGREVARLAALRERLEALLTRGAAADPDLEADGPLAALAGVADFPSRLRCARLPWEAAEAARENPVAAGS